MNASLIQIKPSPLTITHIGFQPTTINELIDNHSDVRRQRGEEYIVSPIIPGCRGLGLDFPFLTLESEAV